MSRQERMEQQTADLRQLIEEIQQASLMQRPALALDAIEAACDLVETIVADRGDLVRQIELLQRSDNLQNHRLQGLENLNGVI